MPRITLAFVADLSAADARIVGRTLPGGGMRIQAFANGQRGRRLLDFTFSKEAVDAGIVGVGENGIDFLGLERWIGEARTREGR